jgi:hypothetical protein
MTRITFPLGSYVAKPEIPPGTEVHRDISTNNLVVKLADRGFVVTREEMEDGKGEEAMQERFRRLIEADAMSFVEHLLKPGQ